MPGCDGAGTAERSYPVSEVRGGGRQELPHAPNPRPGVAARRSCPTSKEQWLRGAQEGLEELSHIEGQEERR